MATIALDATYTLERLPSGVAVYSRRLIESLLKLETPHRFLVCYRLSRFARRREFLSPSTVPGSRPFSVRLFQEPLTFWLPWQAEIFHSLAQRPPAFHFKKEIVTVHDIFPLTGQDYSTLEFQRKFSALLKEAVRRASRVITPSSYTAAQLAKHADVPRERIRVIPEGVDFPSRLLTQEERARERDQHVGTAKEMILCVGVLQTRKNTINALRALELLPERYRMVLAGGDGHGSEAIHEYLRRPGLSSRVRVLGHVSDVELSTLYQSASVLLFPSLEEGFGLPILEAMAAGLPVVAAQTSSLPEVGGDAALYADPNDPACLAELVTRACEDQPLRHKMIEQGLARAREFTWARTALETLRVYDEVVAL
ncbi:MAG: glycosyltransferase family 4 protein [Acidobacteriia bacterium]|nr:glycosyltransferase family 4 protein [Terriglobia bacterium]